MVGAMGGQVAGRSCQGGLGVPGVGVRGSGVARLLPGACKVARGLQASEGEPGVDRSCMEKIHY